MLKKQICLLLSVLMCASIFSGCGKKAETVSVEIEKVYPWVADANIDSSDIPDWQGAQKAFRVWVSGTVGNIKEMKNDVVTPEVQRLTGVSYDKTESIDNAGQTFETKLSMLIAAKDYPDIVFGGITAKLVDAGLVYDLTEYLPKYAPTIMKKFPQYVFDSANISGGRKDKIYAIPYGIGDNYWQTLQGFDGNRVGLVPADSRGYIYVRDDVLKAIYPEAKTQDEIEALYVKNGAFTKEEIFDVPIKSYDDFVKFLYKIKDLSLTEKGRKMYATYGYSGTDNWYLLQTLCSWLEGRGYLNHYFTYWDRKEQKLQLGLKQDFAKNSLSVWNQLILDNVVDKDSLIDTADVFKEKRNNGLYAVTYGQKPDEEVLKKSGAKYRYRKVYLDIPLNEERFLPLEAAANNTSFLAVFKDSVSESELIQLLRFMDFMISDTGSRLVSWGPRSAGLWKEADGKRAFVNKDVEEYVVYGDSTNAEGESYNLARVGWYCPSASLLLQTTFGERNYGFNHPAYVYDRVNRAMDADMHFVSGKVLPVTPRVTILPSIFNIAKEDETVKKAWNVRPEIERAITTVIASKQGEFEKNYSNMLHVLDANGWDENMIAAADKYFREKNTEYMDNLK